MTMDYTKIL